MKPEALYHFSEDSNVQRFAPHVPRTNPTHPPAVWAIDADHAPLYWFPRDCPRVTIWPRRPEDGALFQEQLATVATRVHAIESTWLDRMRNAKIYCYEFDPSGFEPWDDADGQWISNVEVAPISVIPIGDLLEVHVDAGIELRIVPSLWPLHDVARSGEFDFSLVRMRNAQPRHAP